MHTSSTVSIEANPFALMMDPQSVLAAMERLERSTQSQRRICRPLDKPLPTKPADEAVGFDSLVDGSAD